MIVFSDEQVTNDVNHSSFPGPLPGAKGYMINVASAKNGVGYGKWTHIDGFSENVIRWIVEHEQAFV
jgi:60 kDa SS-A/Ro ribonucleoprotein